MAGIGYCTAILIACTQQAPKCVQQKGVEKHCSVTRWRTVWHLTFLSQLSVPRSTAHPQHPPHRGKTMWPWEFKQNSQSLIFYWFVRLEVIYVSLKGGQGCSEMWPASRRSSFHQFCLPGVKRKSPHNLQGELSKRTCPLFLPFCFKPISQFDFQPVPLGRAEREVARRHFSTLC